MDTLPPSPLINPEHKKIQYPHVTFQVNKDVDINTAANFLGLSKAGYDFSRKIIDEHPTLKTAINLVGEERRQAITAYVDDYYSAHGKDIFTTQKKFQEQWDGVEADFFHITQEVFQNHEWPQGKYVAYPSIFNCNPRILDSKEFQVYINNVVGAPAMVAHEMLHFLFFDYLEKKETQLFATLGEKQVWELSEIFNILALQDKRYEKFKPSIFTDYPHLKERGEQILKNLNGPITIRSFLSAATQN